MNLFDLLYVGKKKNFLPMGATYQNSLTKEIEKYLSPSYEGHKVYLREVGDSNYNLDIILDGNIHTPIGNAKRDPKTGWLSYVGLYTGVASEIRCFVAEADNEHLFDAWTKQPFVDIPNPFAK